MTFLRSRVGALCCVPAVLWIQSCGSSGDSNDGDGNASGGSGALDAGAAGEGAAGSNSSGGTAGTAGTDGGEGGVGQGGEAGGGGTAGSGGCVPGTHQCVDETTRQTCDENGEWADEFTCPSACVDDGCAGVCVPGARRCDGLTRQQCNGDGQWANDGAPCPVACSDGACTGTCTPGETQCSSNTELQTCDANREWGTSVECEYACVASECGGACKPGTVECVAGMPSTERRSCGSTGQWDAPAACTYVCTGEGVCGGECTPGATRCTGQQPEHCVNGQWATNGAPCSASEVCRADTATCESCEPFLCGDGRDWVVWQWVGPAGDLNDVEVDASGAIYVAGYTYDTFRDYFAKFDANGQLLWSVQAALESGYWMRMAIDAGGDVWLAGTTGQIARYSSDGIREDLDVVHGGDSLWDMKLDAAGNVYVAGSTGAASNRRPFVARYTPALELLWSQTYLGTEGGGQGVAVDGAGNVYLTGRIEVIENGIGMSSRLLVNRYDSSGTETYSRLTGSCDDGLYINPPGAVTDATGDLYVTGTYCGTMTALMEKWSTTGTQLWKTDVALTGSTAWARELQIKPDGNLIGITGPAQVYSHTPSGELLWTRTYANQGSTVVMYGGFDMVGSDHLVGGAQWSRGGSLQERPMIVFKLRLPPNP